MTEYLLSTNEFSQPKSIEGAEAFGVLLVRLFLLQPGTNPLHPDMGIGLSPKYRFITVDDIDSLQMLIRNQIRTYFPDDFAAAAEVYLEIKDSGYLLITIISDGNKFVFDTENSDTPVQLSETISL